MLKKLSSVINLINIISALWVTAGLIYMPYSIVRIAYILLFASYLIEIFTDRKWQGFRLNKQKTYFLVLAGFFLLALPYIPFDNTPVYTKILIERRMPLLGFGLIGFFGVNRYFKLSYFLNTFIITSIIAIFYLCYHIGFDGILNIPVNHDIFNLARIRYVNTHMMFNFYLNISLVSIWYILTRTWHRIHKLKLFLYIAALSVIFITLSISEGRSGYIAGILLVLCFIFAEIWKRRKVMGIVIAFSIPFILIFAVSTHKRVTEESFENEPRWFLWKSGIEVVKEKPFTGYGISDAQEHFDISRAKYQTEGFRLNWIKNKHLDCHNQFIQITMEFGIIGLLTLLFLYFYPVFIVDNNRILFSIFCLSLCLFQSVFDMFVTGHFSALFCILLLLMLQVKNNVVKSPNHK